MSVSSDLEKMYRKQGNVDLADAVLALLKDDESRAQAVLAIDLEPYLDCESDHICKDISTLLKYEEQVSSDLKIHSVGSDAYFLHLKTLQQQYCLR